MKRRDARKQAFFLIFEMSFNGNSIESILESAQLAREIEIDNFAKEVFNGFLQHSEEIDSIIEKNIIGWKKNRISRVSNALMRVAVFEMLYLDNIPTSVSINEAVEIAKIYGGNDDASFINGVLGAIAKDISKKDA